MVHFKVPLILSTATVTVEHHNHHDASEVSSETGLSARDRVSRKCILKNGRFFLIMGCILLWLLVQIIIDAL